MTESAIANNLGVYVACSADGNANFCALQVLGSDHTGACLCMHPNREFEFRTSPECSSNCRRIKIKENNKRACVYVEGV